MSFTSKRLSRVSSTLVLWVALVVSFAVVVPAGQEPATEPHGPTPEFLEMKSGLEDPAQGWTNLLEGNDLRHWKPLEDPRFPPKPYDWAIPRLVRLDPADPTRLQALPYPGTSAPNPPAPACVNNRRGRSDNLITRKNFRDVELYIEFMVPRQSNSGVCLMGLYEVQIADSFGKTELKYGDNGGIYARVVNQRRVGGEPPFTNVSRPPGEWQSFHIWFRAPRFDADGRKIENARFLRVEHNGTLIHDKFELEGSTRANSPWAEQPEAPLLLQGDHGPVAFRNVYLRSLR